MKHTAAWISLLLCAVLLLGGCAHEEIGIVLHENGSGSITTLAGIENESYERLLALGSEPFEGKETITYQYAGKSYTGLKTVRDYSAQDELENALKELTHGMAAGVPDTPSTTVFEKVRLERKNGLLCRIYTFHAVTTPYQMGDLPEIPLSVDTACSVRLNLPGKIQQTNGELMEDGSVVFEMKDLTAETELTAESIQIDWISLVTVLLLLIGLVIGIVINRRSGKSKA